MGQDPCSWGGSTVPVPQGSLRLTQGHPVRARQPYLATVGVLHDKAEAVVGLEGVLQGLQGTQAGTAAPRARRGCPWHVAVPQAGLGGWATSQGELASQLPLSSVNFEAPRQAALTPDLERALPPSTAAMLSEDSPHSQSPPTRTTLAQSQEAGTRRGRREKLSPVRSTADRAWWGGGTWAGCQNCSPRPWRPGPESEPQAQWGPPMPSRSCLA